MICCSFDVKVIFTATTFRTWGLHMVKKCNKVQKGVWGKMLQSDGEYCYIKTEFRRDRD